MWTCQHSVFQAYLLFEPLNRRDEMVSWRFTCSQYGVASPGLLNHMDPMAGLDSEG